MPKDIWEASVRLERGYDVCRIARGTGLDYVWLRKKRRRWADQPPVAPPSFLEVPVELVMSLGARGDGNKAGSPDLTGTGILIEVAAAGNT